MSQDQFLSFLKNEKRYSPLTLTAYKTDLEQFSSFLADSYEINNISEVEHQMIRSWIVSLIEKEISNRSVNRKISSLKSYYKFLIRQDIVESNPMQKIISPKSSKRLPVFVEKKSMSSLFDEIEYEAGYEGVRDKLMLELFYCTGIRLSEMINLKSNDCSMSNNTIKVIGKGNKERVLPLSKELSGLISAYLEDYQVNDWLFLTKKRKKMYPKLVYRIVYSYLSKVTTLKKKSPHVLRHTFATHMLNNGADLNAIKEFLGHSNLSATQVYTHNSIQKLSDVYNQAHPKA